MKFRQARKILRRGRVRPGTVMAALRRLEQRVTRWHRRDHARNPRPSYTLRDLFRLGDLEPGGWNDTFGQPKFRGRR